MNNKTYRPPLNSLACVNLDCDVYGQTGQGNLNIRKYYGRDNDIRYLRCLHCQEEFSERKNTAFFNCKIAEDKAVSIAEHLAEGISQKATARLVAVDPSTVRRLNKRLGRHGEKFHDEHVTDVDTTELQADERHGFVGNKQTPFWEAEVFDPKSKLVLSHVHGQRNERLIQALFTDTVKRVHDKHQIAMFTDGFHPYATLFPKYFGRPYRPARKGVIGRLRKMQYRIPRKAALVQVIKHRSGYQLKEVEIRYTHGSKKRIDLALDRLNFNVPNTSGIERRNGTSRLMSAPQVRKTLAFARREESKRASGWWSTTVYNWCRAHRSLKQPLPIAVGKKSMHSAPQLWQQG